MPKPCHNKFGTGYACTWIWKESFIPFWKDSVSKSNWRSYFSFSSSSNLTYLRPWKVSDYYFFVFMSCELLRRRHLLVLAVLDCFKTRLMCFFMSSKYSLEWRKTPIDPLFPYPESKYLTGTLSKGFLSCPFCTSTSDWLSQPCWITWNLVTWIT